jgi:fatty-acyl-CoA synthase
MFHITGMVSVMHTTVLVGATLVVMPRWDRDLAGCADLALEGHHLDQHPDDGHRPPGQPELRAATTSPASTYIGGGGAAMPQAVAQRLLEQYGLKYSGGLRPDRDRGALAHQPPSRTPSSSAWASPT